MVSRIDRLTPEQEAQIPAIRDEWLAYGLSTDPADRPEAERGVRDAYVEAGLEPPAVILWADSPFAGAIAVAMLRYLLDPEAGGALLNELAGLNALRQVGSLEISTEVWEELWEKLENPISGVVSRVASRTNGSLEDPATWRDLILKSLESEVPQGIRDDLYRILGSLDRPDSFESNITEVVDDAAEDPASYPDVLVRPTMLKVLAQLMDQLHLLPPSDEGAIVSGVRWKLDALRDDAQGAVERGVTQPDLLTLFLAAGVIHRHITDQVQLGREQRGADRATTRKVNDQPAVEVTTVTHAVGGWAATSVDRRGMFGAIAAAVQNQILDEVWATIRSTVSDQVGWAIWGQHDAGALSSYDFFRRVCDLDVCNRLDGLIRVGRSAGWWWALRGVAVITERPQELHRDAQGRLHNPDGAALLYRDGWGVWAWNGVRVPRDMIEGKWSTDDILRHDNTEVRRAAIEKMGWDRFIIDANLAPVGEPAADPGNPGYFLTLYDVPEEVFETPVRVLVCDNATEERDGTRRRFGLTVPAEIDDPVAAAAWTFNLDADVYRRMTHAY